jgi:ribokinase
MHPMLDVVALGDTNVDIIAHFPSYPAKGQDALACSAELHCGGSAANTAMALAQMGLKVSLISRMGRDFWASKALSGLKEAGVSVTGLQRDPTVMTGLMYVIVTPDGERTILGHRGANVFTDPNRIREEDVRDARLFHLSGYALLADPQRSAALLALEIACRNGLTVTLDPGMSVPQAALDEMRALLPVLNIFLPNLTEAQRLTSLTVPEECAKALLAAGVEVVALKLGRDGCLVGTDEALFRMPGFAVETRDTTGAGDLFAAGLIAAFLGRQDWHCTAVVANAMGAVTAARIGAGMTTFPAQEVLDLLQDQVQKPNHCKHVDTIQRAMDFVMTWTAGP